MWLRNYKLKEEQEARLVMLRFYFEVIGYFAIYLTLAFAFIPFGQDINTGLYRCVVQDCDLDHQPRRDSHACWCPWLESRVTRAGTSRPTKRTRSSP